MTFLEAFPSHRCSFYSNIVDLQTSVVNTLSMHMLVIPGAFPVSSCPRLRRYKFHEKCIVLVVQQSSDRYWYENREERHHSGDVH